MADALAEGFFSSDRGCGTEDRGWGMGEALRSGVSARSPSTPVTTCFSFVTRRLSMMLLSRESLLPPGLRSVLATGTRGGTAGMPDDVPLSSAGLGTTGAGDADLDVLGVTSAFSSGAVLLGLLALLLVGLDRSSGTSRCVTIVRDMGCSGSGLERLASGVDGLTVSVFGSGDDDFGRMSSTFDTWFDSVGGFAPAPAALSPATSASSCISLSSFACRGRT